MAAGGETLIELDGVSKQFRQGNAVVQALSAVDLGIGRGEFVSIVGPSGCGKSTLLRLVAGLMPASTGRVAIGGGPPESHKNDIGIVFQAPVLLDWRDVLGNVLFPIDMRGLRVADYQERAHSLLKLVGLADFAAAHPYQLSGGMKQRCAIARALVHDPGLLLMDEPFGALDALTREQMRIDLERIWMQSHKTVLFITHSIDEAVLLSDRVIVMSPRPGRIERVLEVDMPRPRGFDGRKHPAFTELNDVVTAIFLERGVFH
ncbi:MAG TPA: ABC transporter ATP-binding protein [Geminicoccaceae bacterium]|nr:ABC transporter ATP-binding protein [Geminicoccus sp.]HMU50892.1 ABC transporter ATP-binding protein [Geminicoccaceae bacterium]